MVADQWELEVEAVGWLVAEEDLFHEVEVAGEVEVPQGEDLETEGVEQQEAGLAVVVVEVVGVEVTEDHSPDIYKKYWDRRMLYHPNHLPTQGITNGL